LYSADSSDDDMKCIDPRLCRHEMPSNQFVCDLFNQRAGGNQIGFGQHLEAFLGSLHVTHFGFIEYDLRRNNTKSGPFIVPPIACLTNSGTTGRKAI